MDTRKMVFNWEQFPTATHCDSDGFCFYHKDEEGVWMLLEPDGQYSHKSVSMYNGELSPDNLFKRPAGV